MPSIMFRHRLDSARRLLHNEVKVVRGVVSDVRQRVGLSHGSKEPHGTRHLGGLMGRRGSLVKEPVVIVARTVDNVIEFVQEQAEINRRQIPRRHG